MRREQTISEHNRLLLRAERWLKNTIGCGVIFREYKAFTNFGEIPDVIGWIMGKCFMVEVKATRDDFLSDKRKKCRYPENVNVVLGHWRMYVTPPGLISHHEIPEGWGLYEVHKRSVRHAGGVKYCNAGGSPFQPDRDSEVAIMYSALRRLEIRIDRLMENNRR